MYARGHLHPSCLTVYLHWDDIVRVWNGLERRVDQRLVQVENQARLAHVVRMVRAQEALPGVHRRWNVAWHSRGRRGCGRILAVRSLLHATAAWIFGLDAWGRKFEAGTKFCVFWTLRLPSASCSHPDRAENVFFHRTRINQPIRKKGSSKSACLRATK